MVMEAVFLKIQREEEKAQKEQEKKAWKKKRQAELAAATRPKSH